MRKKILISAYACEPNRGSEHGVGWHWVINLARYYDLYVITRKDNKKTIEKETFKLPFKIHFEYIDLPKFLSFWKRGQKGLLLYYSIWQILALFKALQMNRKIRFHAIWHLTFGNIWFPPPIALISKNFIWGPIGGVDLIPKSLWKYLDLQSKFKELIRTAIIFSLKLNPLFYLACKKTKVILTRTPNTTKWVTKIANGKIIEIPETGTINFNKTNHIKNTLHKTLIYVGRLEYFKGLNIALHALHLLKSESPNISWRFIIVGNGPEFKKLKKLVKKLNLEKEVLFTGTLEREKVFSHLEKADIFLFPSLREGTSWALIEAMTLGLVPIVLDIGGNSLVIDENSGIKIKVHSDVDLLKELSFNIAELLINDDLRKKISIGAIQKAQNDLNWEAKIERVKNIMESII